MTEPSRPPSATVAVPDERRNHGPMRVLLLDDDDFMLAVMADQIEDLGAYDVATETDCQCALAALRREPPQLLICDLAMPDMDGIEFLRRAAAEQYRGSVVLLSGVDAGVLQAASRLARADGIHLLAACAKPLAREDLALLLAQAAARPRCP